MGLIEDVYWSTTDKFNLLDDINIDELRDFATIFLGKLKVQALIQGNVTKQHAVKVMKNVLVRIKCAKIDVSMKSRLFFCLKDFSWSY